MHFRVLIQLTIAAFVAVQLIAAVVATLSFRWLLDERQAEAELQGDP